MKTMETLDINAIENDTDGLDDFEEEMPGKATVFMCARQVERRPRKQRTAAELPRGEPVRLLVEDMPRPLKPPGRR